MLAALDSFVEETDEGVRSFFGSIQDGSITQVLCLTKYITN